jgi:Na+/melibiose symporter-like transporter
LPRSLPSSTRKASGSLARSTCNYKCASSASSLAMFYVISCLILCMWISCCVCMNKLCVNFDKADAFAHNVALSFVFYGLYYHMCFRNSIGVMVVISGVNRVLYPHRFFLTMLKDWK